MEIYKSTAASITYNAEHNCIVQKINSFFNSEELKNFQTDLIKFCEKRNVKRIIADTTNLKVVKADDMSWLSGHVLPSLSNYGVECFAVVMPNNPFGQVAIDTFVQASSKITIKVFEDLVSAKSWARRFTISPHMAIS